MLPTLERTLKALPPRPGVYLMKDRRGEIFYIGKAKSLRARVRAYFSGTDTRAFVALLDGLLHDIEVVLTHSEKEALILENELIKKHQPRFNVELKDDKNFLCLRLDTRKTYPRLEVVRRLGRDGARYFGPYHSASSIRETLRIINRHFQLRTCSDQVLSTRQRPCLQYQIQRCPAPCVFDLSGGDYAQNVDNVIAFLEGRGDELIRTLTARMRERSMRLEYELAARLRDQLRAVQRSLERQSVVSADFINRDVVGLYREGSSVEIHVLRTRAGRLMDAQRYSIAQTELPSGEILSDFAVRYYDRGEDVPDEIVFGPQMQWASALAGFLTEKLGRKIKVIAAQRGPKRALVTLAERNAEQAYADKRRQDEASRSAAEGLQRGLHLRRAPHSIECVDISHLQGGHIVGSLVRFDGGLPSKQGYRHFKIRSTQGQDDFQAIYEVVSRRARRGLEAGDLPDLLVIDGGKGQLAAARAALDDHGVDEVDLISLAKERPVGTDGQRRTGRRAPDDDVLAKSPERVFVRGLKEPILLKQTSAELYLLVRLRDEAHRFALTQHRKARQKSMSRSVLDEIPGIGPKRRRALLKTFGSAEAVTQADETALAQVVGAAAARTLRNALAAQKPAARAQRPRRGS